MIEMRHACGAMELVEGKQQRDRIRAPRDRDESPVAGIQHPMLVHRPFNIACKLGLHLTLIIMTRHVETLENACGRIDRDHGGGRPDSIFDGTRSFL